MTTISPYLSKITLNVNGLNSTIKRHIMAKEILFKNQYFIIHCLQEIYLGLKNIHELRRKSWKKIFQGKCNHKSRGSLHIYHAS